MVVASGRDGVVFCVEVELATGRFPYEGCVNDFEVLAKILGDEPPLVTADMGFSPTFCSFIRDCLTKDYHKRPKYRKLLVRACTQALPSLTQSTLHLPA